MIGRPDRCESCDAGIGGARTCRHCGWIRPTAGQRADDRVRMAVAIVLILLVMIVATAIGIGPR